MPANLIPYPHQSRPTSINMSSNRSMLLLLLTTLLTTTIAVPNRYQGPNTGTRALRNTPRQSCPTGTDCACYDTCMAEASAAENPCPQCECTCSIEPTPCPAIAVGPFPCVALPPYLGRLPVRSCGGLKTMLRSEDTDPHSALTRISAKSRSSLQHDKKTHARRRQRLKTAHALHV